MTSSRATPRLGSASEARAGRTALHRSGTGGRARADTAEADTRRPGRPRDDELDSRILQTAGRLLHDSGYQAVTIERVATLAGVGRPTVYRRWPTRTWLVCAAIAASSPDDVAPDTGALRTDLLVLVTEAISIMTAPAWRESMPALLADLLREPAAREAFLDQWSGPRAASVAQAFDRAEHRGEVEPGFSWMPVVDLLLGPIFYRVLLDTTAVTSADGPVLLERVLRAFPELAHLARRD